MNDPRVWWQDGFYQSLCAMGVVAMFLFVWGMHHLSRNDKERKVFATEVGGLATWASGLLVGMILMTLMFQIDAMIGQGY